MKPLVSILIPPFKSSPYYTRCIESILRQTHAELEVLVTGTNALPDGTCDERVQALGKYRGSDFDALNDALDRAKGEFAFFCDVDAVLSPSLLENLLKNADRALPVVPIARVTEDGAVGNADTAQLSFVGKLFDVALLREHSLRFDKDAACPECDFTARYIPLCTGVICCTNGYMYVNEERRRTFAEKELSKEAADAVAELKALYRKYVEYDAPIEWKGFQTSDPQSGKKVVYQIQSRQGAELGNYVVREYEEGRLGVSYLFRFLKAWLRCKIKR